jgi:hypothetical protein
MRSLDWQACWEPIEELAGNDEATWDAIHALQKSRLTQLQIMQIHRLVNRFSPYILRRQQARPQPTPLAGVFF